MQYGLKTSLFHKMVAISSPEHRVILIGFDSERVKSILADEAVTKLVIFDSDDDNRSNFEKVYPMYKDRITLYEGAIESNLKGYLELREQEGITLKMHRICGQSK